MTQSPDVERILHRARLLLQEGQNDLALVGLEAISADNDEQQQESAYLRGVAYMMSGQEYKVKANQAAGEQRRKLLKEAIAWFEKAEKQFSITPKQDKVAEMYSSWAEALEELGYLQEALIYLKSAYKASLTEEPL